MKKFILFCLIVLLLGCAAGPAVKKPEITKSNLPQQHLIDNVPMYRQTYMDCGPTSLRMVLSFYGKSLSQEEIGRARRGRVTSVPDIEDYPRSLGFKVYSFSDWKEEHMKYLLVQGYPLIVLGIIPSNWYSGRYAGQGHYVVVTGYDDLKKVFVINDPGPGVTMEIPYDVFKDFHRSSSYEPFYVLCIYPKGE